MRKFAIPAEVRAIDEERREITSLVSTETVDSYGEILLAEGADLDRYRKNPVVLWAHDQGQPPIGNASRIEAIGGEGIEAVTKFHQFTQVARDAWELYKAGIMKAWSVGFNYDWSGDESPWRYDSKLDAFVVIRWELYEYSAVPVPANADALTRAAGDGCDAAARVLRAAGLPDHPPTPEERLAADLQRAIGGLTGLRNYRRHCEKTDTDFPVEPDRLAEADALLREILGAPKAADTPPPPEPDPAVGDPSEEQVARALTAVVDGLTAVTAQIEALPQQMRTVATDAVAAERRRYIGGRR